MCETLKNIVPYVKSEGEKLIRWGLESSGM
jgi:hypothetical protein